jgi:ACT domain
MFGPDIAARSPTGNLRRVHISKDTYSVLCINRAGLEAGLLELMASFAVVGIPIFFITTFSIDYILVPSKDRQTVENCLSTTPHASTINELQTRTISQLRQKNTRPFVEPGLQLVLCSGNEVAGEDENSTRPRMIPSWLEKIDRRFYTGLTSALAHQPRFLSVTLSQDNLPSLLIDKSLLGLFGGSIMSDREVNLVPLFFDLVDIPSEFTGIECGVAGALTDEMMKESKRIASHGWELSFLSMAQAGALLLASENKDMALGVLLRLFDQGKNASKFVIRRGHY